MRSATRSRRAFFAVAQGIVPPEDMAHGQRAGERASGATSSAAEAASIDAATSAGEACPRRANPSIGARGFCKLAMRRRAQAGGVSRLETGVLGVRQVL